MVIVAEQSVARSVFVVLAGNVEQSMHDAGGVDVILALLGRGDLFGEGGLFGLRYRRTTVRATTRSFILQFKYADLQMHGQRLPEFFNALRVQFRERLLQTTLARVPLLATLNPVERLSLTQQLDDQRVERGATIMTEGGTSDGLYIIAEGQARVEQAGHTLAVLEPGDVFGEMSLLDNAPHEASIIALTPVHLLILPRSTFEYALTQRPDIAAGLHQLVVDRKQTDRTAEHVTTTEHLIETGIVRGKMVLVRQADLCAPDCRRCEEACADRFTVSRLSFSGESFGDWEAADLCRHCQWGAECVEVCPDDAFRLDSSGHLIITDRCTGCGSCIPACPYHAINQVPVYSKTSNPLAWLLRQVGKQQPIMMRANKCDACHGYDNHACIDACPTGALQWVPVSTLYQPSKSIDTIQLTPA
jgi:CRP-like cAMP-binding protein/Pyruvate/2-oxoacid:ferredoxin oxidoreductase delta subunit